MLLQAKIIFLGTSIFILSSLTYLDDNRNKLCKKLPNKETCTVNEKEVWGKPPKNSLYDSLSKVVITPKNGKKIKFINKPEDGEGHLSYVYEGYLSKVGFFVIYHRGWEWGSTSLISYANGKRYSLDGTPNMSPNGKYFFVSIIPYGDEYLERIKLYSISKFGSRLLKEYDLRKKKSYKAIWVTSSKIAIFTLVLKDGDFTTKAEYKILIDKGTVKKITNYESVKGV